MPAQKSDFIEAMVKHLPPSAADLRLLDVGGATGTILRQFRPDIEVVVASLLPQQWQFDDQSFDAIAAYDMPLDDAYLAAILRLLRPGGRFVQVNPIDQELAPIGTGLLQAGFVRCLVEPAVAGVGVLLRGERAHTTADTLERVQGVAERDADQIDLSNFRGRYVHLLVRQQPNKPVWRLQPDEVITWDAVAVGQGEHISLLAFSSLPKAVSFMQAAVLEDLMTGINKVGKFSQHTAAEWSYPVMVNPTLESISGAAIQFIPINPATAETPDE
ncbi:MAG: class I SAM-dependent methyltransferase [Anaerolineaceae bacterium]|nr:class I SAM-dependent methyltransferase [Anaerolineaceae bacterium]